jgi:hypothetical protein
MVLDVAPGGMMRVEDTNRLLGNIGARPIAIKMDGQRRLFAMADLPPRISDVIETGSESWLSGIANAVTDLLDAGNGVMLVASSAPMKAEHMEIVIDAQALHNAILRFSTEMLVLLLIVGAVAACSIYLTLDRLVVRGV